MLYSGAGVSSGCVTCKRMQRVETELAASAPWLSPVPKTLACAKQGQLPAGPQGALRPMRLVRGATAKRDKLSSAHMRAASTALPSEPTRVRQHDVMLCPTGSSASVLNAVFHTRCTRAVQRQQT